MEIIKFTKMQGIGNDYVYIDCTKKTMNVDYKDLARKISDRHFGVGSDGLILILPSTKADFEMRMFNSDGSEAEMCGNAVRCVGKYVFDRRLTDKTTVTIDTLAGIKILEMTLQDGAVNKVRVDMGEPVLEPVRIPVATGNERFIAQPVKAAGDEVVLTCVSMGNPHAVMFVEEENLAWVDKVGPVLEKHEMFPRKANVEFVHVENRGLLKVRVWERGAGETLACGTGACAVLVAAVLNNVSERNAVVRLLGGDLEIEWNENDNHVYMTGPAEWVFDGEYYY